MVRRNNGFTLIEVLAVIIILGTIVAIAVPAMLERIEKSKQNSAMSSTEFYIDALQKASVFPQTPGKEIVIGGTYDITTLVDKVDLDKGKSKPTSGFVIIDDEGIVLNASLCVNNYKVDYANNKAIVDSEATCDDIVMPDEEEIIVSGYDYLKGVNKPVLTTGMTPIKWDVSNNEIVTTEDDTDWYDYANKKWANAKTADGSYWVWIPRYAYKITSNFHTSTAGTIDIKFLKGTTNITEDSTVIEASGYQVGVKDTSNNYFVHPAFDFDGPILGYWVAKFEASGTKSYKPNVVAASSITISSMMDYSLNLKNDSKFGWTAASIDSHLMKNNEWGAVAYLVQSVYGKNSEVWSNNSSQYTTGCCGSSVSATAYAGCENTYNSAIGVNASTTGNITGIYGMSGGAIELVSTYVNNGHSNLTTYGLSVLNANLKYKSIYLMGTTDTAANNLIANINVYGDAIYETSNGISGGTSAWNADRGSMATLANPFFTRGGGPGEPGIFTFSSSGGSSANGYGYRATVIVLN